MPTDLVTLTQVKEALSMPLDVDHDDNQLHEKLVAAHEIVLDAARQWADPATKAARVAEVNAWTMDTAPSAVKASIIELVADMYGDRGDDPQKDERRRHWALSPRAHGFMTFKRDPVVR